jgi:hypothetical protein
METEKPKSPVNLSREDLYVQVWKTPLLRLAAQYGISGTGLSKICSRVDPPPSHRTSLRCGGAVASVVLRTCDPLDVNEVLET